MIAPAASRSGSGVSLTRDPFSTTLIVSSPRPGSTSMRAAESATYTTPPTSTAVNGPMRARTTPAEHAVLVPERGPPGPRNHHGPGKNRHRADDHDDIERGAVADSLVSAH